MAKQTGGKIVNTKSGTGKTKNSDKPIWGKIPVYLDNGGKVLCSPSNIQETGIYE